MLNTRPDHRRLKGISEAFWIELYSLELSNIPHAGSPVGLRRSAGLVLLSEVWEARV